MPIFVKGEVFRGLPASRGVDDDEESRLTEYLDDNETTLMRAALPSRDELSGIFDLDAKDALDIIQKTISARRKAPLADDLSSVGSMPMKTPLSVVHPIAEYKTNPDSISGLIRRSKRELSIDTQVSVSDDTSSTNRYRKESVASSNLSASPYKLNPINKWDVQRNSRGGRIPARPQLTVVTDVDDETRDDPTDEQFRAPSSNLDRELKSAAGAEVDEPSKTLEDLLELLEKGYRVKLHTFRGREKAFLYIGSDRQKLFLKKTSNSKKIDDGTIWMETFIENIVNLEFGRRSDSGFLLSPLTSFSLGVIGSSGSESLEYFDLEAASPVQREVLVSTLMIIMDAFGSDRTPEPANDEPCLSEDQDSLGTDDRYEVQEDETGTFDQPIPCSPSLEPIPCTPSLELEASMVKPESKNGANDNIILLHDVDSFPDEGENIEEEEECGDVTFHRSGGVKTNGRSGNQDSLSPTSLAQQVDTNINNTTSRPPYLSFHSSDRSFGSLKMMSKFDQSQHFESFDGSFCNGTSKDSIKVAESRLSSQPRTSKFDLRRPCESVDEFSQSTWTSKASTTIAESAFRTRSSDAHDFDYPALHETNSSGEMTSHKSNLTNDCQGLTSPIVTVADDLVIEAHLSNQSSVAKPERRPTSSSGTLEKETKEESYIFKEEESVFSGSAQMPIDAEMDPIIRMRTKPQTLSFSFSDHSYDGDGGEGESVQGMLHSVRTRRSTKPYYDASSLTKPSYPARILEVEELHDMPLREGSSGEAATRTSYGSYRSAEMNRDPSFGNNDTASNSIHTEPEVSLIEKTALVEINTPILEVPTPYSLHMSGSSSHLIGGWCSDDICTGTLNDMAKSCTGMFGAEQARNAMAHAACLDPSLTDDQTVMLEEYITSALGAPSAVYSYFTEAEAAAESMLKTTGTVQQASDTRNTWMPDDAQKFRNRASRSNAQASRFRNLRNEMTFANALRESQERSSLRSTQSFDDAKLLPRLADNAAQRLHTSPLLDSIVSNMMQQWTNGPFVPTEEGAQNIEEESVYYDSDPEDSRPRTIHHGPRKIQSVGVDKVNNSDTSRPKALDGFGLEHLDSKLGKRADEDVVKEIVQTMMNERLLVMWHPTQSQENPNRAPILARLWIESGVYLIDGSFLLPKLSWVKAFGQSSRRGGARGGAVGSNQELHKVDLLDICRIRSCTRVDRSMHPFANCRLSWIVETQKDVLLFESETTEERDRIVYGLKLVVARLASLLMLRDIRAADEFFGAVSAGVPGEAPVWTASQDDDHAATGSRE